MLAACGLISLSSARLHPTRFQEHATVRHPDAFCVHRTARRNVGLRFMAPSNSAGSTLSSRLSPFALRHFGTSVDPVSLGPTPTRFYSLKHASARSDPLQHPPPSFYPVLPALISFAQLTPASASSCLLREAPTSFDLLPPASTSSHPLRRAVLSPLPSSATLPSGARLRGAARVFADVDPRCRLHRVCVSSNFLLASGGRLGS